MCGRSLPTAETAQEKLNGRGYPCKVAAQDVPVQSRMMTIAAMDDALPATDRVLDIIGYEVKDGHLDPDLFAIFTGAKIYARTARK